MLPSAPSLPTPLSLGFAHAPRTKLPTTVLLAPHTLHAAFPPWQGRLGRCIPRPRTPDLCRKAATGSWQVQGWAAPFGADLGSVVLPWSLCPHFPPPTHVCFQVHQTCPPPLSLGFARILRAKLPATILLAPHSPHCYVLGLTQGAFFIFHLLTKPFPSCDQPPIHLDHMTNHLTSHLTTHMTGHMPFQSPAPQSHLPYITCSSKSPVLYHLLPSHLRVT